MSAQKASVKAKAEKLVASVLNRLQEAPGDEDWLPGDDWRPEEEPGEDEFSKADHQKPVDWSKAQFTKGGLPPGAKRVHLYPIQDVLRPRGPMSKESLSLAIFDKLQSAFQDWTDSKYGDSLPPEKVISVLKQNLDSEVQAAWDAFLDGGAG